MHRLPLDVLKNFSHKMISLVFVFDKHSIAAELSTAACVADGDNSAVDLAAVAAACVTACELIIKDAHLAGCTTISLASSEWTRTTADPMVHEYIFVCIFVSLNIQYCAMYCPIICLLFLYVEDAAFYEEN